MKSQVRFHVSVGCLSVTRPVTQREPAGRQHQLVPQDIIDDANEKAKAAMEESDDDDDDDDAMAT